MPDKVGRLSTYGGRDAFALFAALCELSEEAEDSSNVLFGERYPRLDSSSGSGYGIGDCKDGVGEGDREEGRGIWEGVDGNGGVFSSTVAGRVFRCPRFEAGLTSFVFALDEGFLGGGEGGTRSSSGAGVS